MSLDWRNDRWHCDGKPIHAGDGMEMECPDGTWQPVRIESWDCGRILNAHFDWHGFGLFLRVIERGKTGSMRGGLRWPKETRHRYQPAE